eukprot:TRINITY_DN49_c0_g1_i17.p1 TRINITY_DN49_c0_g1~~TRINITY_DN49_c0_g1_i17.p1  ORF type:complete len:169 (+),score=22.25 TRINITY_DN49_c0_g1_i17:781-1287(+)
MILKALPAGLQKSCYKKMLIYAAAESRMQGEVTKPVRLAQKRVNNTATTPQATSSPQEIDSNVLQPTIESSPSTISDAGVVSAITDESCSTVSTPKGAADARFHHRATIMRAEQERRLKADALRVQLQQERNERAKKRVEDKVSSLTRLRTASVQKTSSDVSGPNVVA